MRIGASLRDHLPRMDLSETDSKTSIAGTPISSEGGFMAAERFAERVRGIELSGIRRMFEGAGKDAINLGLGQPDFPTPAHIGEAAIRAIHEGKTGYTVNAGIPELREEIAEKLLRENALRYDPSNVIVTAGASEALHIVMQALVDQGDRVLMADPGFVSYAALAALAGGRAEGLPLDAILHIDVEAAKGLYGRAPSSCWNTTSDPSHWVGLSTEVQCEPDAYGREN